MIDPAVAAGRALHPRGAPPPRALVAPHGGGRIVGLRAPGCRPAPRHPRSPSPRPGRGTAASGGRRPRAASPGRRPSGRSGGRSYSAHFCQRSGTRQELARRLRPVPRREMREQFLARAVGAPAGLGPAVADDGDDVDQRAALHRIVHEMRVAAEPELDVGRAEFRARRASAGTSARQAVRWRKCGARCARAARAASTTVRRRRSARCRARRRRRRRAGRPTVTPLACTTKSSTRVPSCSAMSGLARTASSSAACRSARWIAQ